MQKTWVLSFFVGNNSREMNSDEVIQDAWIYQLSLKQLRGQASLRGLETGGTVSDLRARLIRYERTLRGDPIQNDLPLSPALTVVPAVDVGKLDPIREEENVAVEDTGLSGAAVVPSTPSSVPYSTSTDNKVTLAASSDSDISFGNPDANGGVTFSNPLSTSVPFPAPTHPNISFATTYGSAPHSAPSHSSISFLTSLPNTVPYAAQSSDSLSYATPSYTQMLFPTPQSNNVAYAAPPQSNTSFSVPTSSVSFAFLPYSDTLCQTQPHRGE